MATITVRNLPDDVQRALKRRAAAHDRSMEAEVRAILEETVSEGAAVTGWLDFGAELRADHGGVDLELPERTPGRELDLA